jgi:hypothetical protein
VEIAVNHLTRMSSGYVCVAGLDQDGRHVRPVVGLGRLERGLIADFGGPFQVGAVVELGDVVPRPRPPEFEDHVFDPAHAQMVRMADEERLWRFMEELSDVSLGAIFGDAMQRDGNTASMPAATGRASLGVYRPRSGITVDRRYGRLRVDLDDSDLGRLSLPLTDVRLYDLGTNTVNERRAELLVDRLRRRAPLLAVGVGRPWAREGEEPRHWLQVNNVHLDDNLFWPG